MSILNYPVHITPKTWRWLRIIAAALASLYILLLIDRFTRVRGPAQVVPYKAKTSDIYYQRDTPSFFPPTPPANASQPCANFPAHLHNDIQLVLKTGVGEIDRAEANLAASSSCFPNVLVVSDVDQQRVGRHFVDILADLPPSYYENNTDLDIYTQQKAAIAKGEEIHYTHEGWKLDRFKFLPMVERAYRTNPHAKWYVFTEGDVYIFWDSMLRVLSQYSPTDKHLFGLSVADAHSRDFAYGGASFALSHALLQDFVEGHPEPPSVAFEALVREDCCGDAVLAIALHNRTGVLIESMFPMFTGEDLFSLPLDREKWCSVLVSLHRAQPAVAEGLWHWERTRPYTEEPLVWSDLLHHTHSFLRNESIRENWDNLSGDVAKEKSRAHESAEQCSRACSRQKRCLQYTYTKNECRFGQIVKLGFATKQEEGECVSGWMTDKLRALGFDAEDDAKRVCRSTLWRKPDQKQEQPLPTP